MWLFCPLFRKELLTDAIELASRTRVLPYERGRSEALRLSSRKNRRVSAWAGPAVSALPALLIWALSLRSAEPPPPQRVVDPKRAGLPVVDAHFHVVVGGAENGQAFRLGLGRAVGAGLGPVKGMDLITFLRRVSDDPILARRFNAGMKTTNKPRRVSDARLNIWLILIIFVRR